MFVGDHVPIKQDVLYVRKHQEHDPHYEVDYSKYRYSKGAIPSVFFLLVCCGTVLALTFWKGGFGNGRGLQNGVPRDMEPWALAEDGDGGVPRINRNFRLAASCMAMMVTVIIGLVFYANPTPKLQRILYLVLDIFCLLSFILAVTAFGLDVGHTGDAQSCITDPFYLTKTCKSREGYMLIIVAFDVITAVMAFIVTIIVLMWAADYTFRRKYHHWRKFDRLKEEAEVQPYADRRPGIDWVHTRLCLGALVALFLSAAALLTFTIMLHQLRERVVGPLWDTVSDPPQEYSGWPAANTVLRLLTSIAGGIVCLVFFVMPTRRELAYLVAACFLVVAGLFFLCIALDTGAVDQAQSMTCPAVVVCTFGIYFATCVVEYIAGIAMCCFVIWEYIVRHEQSQVFIPKVPYVPPPPLIPGIYDDPDNPPPPPPPVCGYFGIDIVEVNHLETSEMCVLVANVVPGGPCHAAGALVDDVLFSWNGDAILDKADFAAKIKNTNPNLDYLLQVLRTVIVKNEEFPDEGDHTHTSVVDLNVRAGYQKH